MTVEELIRELEKLPKDKVVEIPVTNSFGPINKITEYPLGIEVECVIED